MPSDAPVAPMISLRPLVPSDLGEVQLLHEEWFPVRYGCVRKRRGMTSDGVRFRGAEECAAMLSRCSSRRPMFGCVGVVRRRGHVSVDINRRGQGALHTRTRICASANAHSRTHALYAHAYARAHATVSRTMYSSPQGLSWHNTGCSTLCAEMLKYAYYGEEREQGRAGGCVGGGGSDSV